LIKGDTTQAPASVKIFTVDTTLEGSAMAFARKHSLRNLRFRVLYTKWWDFFLQWELRVRVPGRERPANHIPPFEAFFRETDPNPAEVIADLLEPLPGYATLEIGFWVRTIGAKFDEGRRLNPRPQARAADARKLSNAVMKAVQSLEYADLEDPRVVELRDRMLGGLRLQQDRIRRRWLPDQPTRGSTAPREPVLCFFLRPVDEHLEAGFAVELRRPAAVGFLATLIEEILHEHNVKAPWGVTFSILERLGYVSANVDPKEMELLPNAKAREQRTGEIRDAAAREIRKLRKEFLRPGNVDALRVRAGFLLDCVTLSPEERLRAAKLVTENVTLNENDRKFLQGLEIKQAEKLIPAYHVPDPTM
jgi:hypothetical protein